jgi:hypothetical protein
MTDETTDHSHKFNIRIQVALFTNICHIIASNLLVVPARMASTADRSFYFRSQTLDCICHQILIPVSSTTTGCFAYDLGFCSSSILRFAPLSHCGGAFQCSHGEEILGFKTDEAIKCNVSMFFKITTLRLKARLLVGSFLLGQMPIRVSGG